jgi:aspartyl protease family protein
MAFSSGGRRLLIDTASWVAALVLIAVSVLYFSELKALARGALGLPDPAQLAAPVGKVSPNAKSVAGLRPSGGPSVELRAGAYGHFHTTADVNGRGIDVLVDTGASMVALTYDDARRAGVFVRPSDFTQTVSTANGHARVAPVALDSVDIGGVRVRNVQGVVVEAGKMEKTLLGMSYLSRLQKVEMGAGRLLLVE